MQSIFSSGGQRPQLPNKFLPKRGSFPQFLETSNSGVKGSDPDLGVPGVPGFC